MTLNASTAQTPKPALLLLWWDADDRYTVSGGTYIHFISVENPEPYNWSIQLKPSREEKQYRIMPHTAMATTTLDMCMSLRNSLFQ